MLYPNIFMLAFLMIYSLKLLRDTRLGIMSADYWNSLQCTNAAIKILGISKENFDSLRDCIRENYITNQIEKFVSTIVIIIFFIYNGFSHLEAWVVNIFEILHIPNDDVFISLGALTLIAVFCWLWELIKYFYRSFAIEKYYGFYKEPFKHFFINAVIAFCIAQTALLILNLLILNGVLYVADSFHVQRHYVAMAFYIILFALTPYSPFTHWLSPDLMLRKYLPNLKLSKNHSDFWLTAIYISTKENIPIEDIYSQSIFGKIQKMSNTNFYSWLLHTFWWVFLLAFLSMLINFFLTSRETALAIGIKRESILTDFVIVLLAARSLIQMLSFYVYTTPKPKPMENDLGVGATSQAKKNIL